jgi:DNA polymerase-3 subunit epsilon
MNFADGVLISADTETTGVDVETSRILSACVIFIRPGAEPDVHQWVINPGVPVPESATAIHGLTDDYVREYGGPPADCIAEIGDELRRGWAAGGVVVGYNLSFDLTLIDRECRRHLGRPFQVMGPIADGFILDKHTDKYRKGSRKLAAVAEHHQVKQLDAHDALGDAFAAARVVWKIARTYPEIGEMDLRDLYRLQVKARAEQASGLQDHLRRKAHDAGQSVADIEAIIVDPFWPIKPVPTTTAAATEEQGTLL